MTESIRLIRNPRVDRSGPLPAAAGALVSLESCRQARATISEWEEYAETPLLALHGFADAHSIATLYYKDEAGRFGLGSFKALGGAYAVSQLTRHKGSDLTVACATDGNHGRAVAWGAQRAHCQCVVYLHAGVSAARERAISAFGARIVRVQGTYDDSVDAVARDAAQNGWHLVSDASSQADQTSCAILHGYGVIFLEMISQFTPETLPTHVFLQAGVGGLASVIGGLLWEAYGVNRPLFVTVEPHQADCVYQSIQTGRLVHVEGTLDTIMAGLACGVPSELAWAVLGTGVDFAMTIPDAIAVTAVRDLATGAFGDPPLIAGESGVAGLAGAHAALQQPEMRRTLGLGPQSRVLVIGTEGATDPELWSSIVGMQPDQISARGRQ